MGAASSERPASDREILRVLKALADPVRFRMVQEIARVGELSCGEVTERFDLSQPTISHHMKILFDAGLLTQRTEGKHHFASVDQALLAEVVELLPRRLGGRVTRARASAGNGRRRSG